MAGGRPPFRRRIFLIKHGFQTRFALYPILFLAAFLGSAGVYLYRYLQDIFRFQLYLPHSHLENPWHEVQPVLAEVALWGGAAFLLVLSLWVWRRFGRLRRDLDNLADWLAAHARGEGTQHVPHYKDREVELLGQGLEKAVLGFEDWERRSEESLRALAEAARAVAEAPADATRIAAVQRGCLDLERLLAEVEVDEALS